MRPPAGKTPLLCVVLLNYGVVSISGFHCTDLVKVIIIFKFVKLEFYKGFIPKGNRLNFVYMFISKYSILSH